MSALRKLLCTSLYRLGWGRVHWTCGLLEPSVYRVMYSRLFRAFSIVHGWDRVHGTCGLLSVYVVYMHVRHMSFWTSQCVG